MASKRKRPAKRYAWKAKARRAKRTVVSKCVTVTPGNSMVVPVPTLSDELAALFGAVDKSVKELRVEANKEAIDQITGGLEL